MAARDQAIFLETVIGLQRALKRRSYGECCFVLSWARGRGNVKLAVLDDPDILLRTLDSDSDSEIERSTNRGSKLKRRARFVRQGKLGAADGLAVFAETIEHEGYRRDILSHNLPLIDDEGYEVDSDEEDDAVLQEAEAAAAEQKAYAGIQLEHLLAPLTAVTDLPTHPTLSRPFANKALTELATQGCNWMHKESAALWKVKPLLIKLCGDHVWVDSGLMETPTDADLFDDSFVARLMAAREGADKISGGLVENGHAASAPAANQREKEDEGADNSQTESADRGDGYETNVNGLIKPRDPHESGDVDVRASIPLPAGQPGDADSSDGFIHPLFLAPRSAHPEPNLGLPEAEAEDVRRLLQLWVQKQEEVSRGTKRLHEGLLRADRLRRTVLRWAKAEAHSGPNRDMSDGEDWYDQEEWELEESLKKGHDEEEEDQQLPNKKTRNRK
ncbi:hypothetical protein SEPCBS119000_005117 [Sporothrix epigloea]|uniref:Transcriptional regulatory protein RXT2 N-terminal domain-containing protein n=1 Tax=Sporothrix epigloea TaxID=1892477 RepID=A0ABP0DW47_9PEZI